MAQQIIDVGNVANDGQGDPLRTAFIKTNQNFTELYNAGGVSGIANGTSNITIAEDSTINMAVAGVNDVVVVDSTGLTVTGIATATIISAVSNVYSSYYFGNGSTLTGLNNQNANSLTGTTLSANVVNSSLTNVGILTVLSVSGNINVAGNVTSNSTVTANNIISNNSLAVGGNSTFGGGITAGGIISTTANVVANNIIGNIDFASVSTPGNVTGGNILTSGTVSAVGNVTGNYVLGNGSLLTGIAGAYSNANVAAYLPTYTGALTGSSLSLSGSILSEVSTASNVTGAYFLGNGSQLTGVLATAVGVLPTLSVTGNATVGNLSSAGNVTVNSLKGVSLSLTGNLISPLLTSENITTDGTLTANIANVTGQLNMGGNIDMLNQSMVNATSANAVTYYGNGLELTDHAYIGTSTISGTPAGNVIWSSGNITATSNLNANNAVITNNINAGGLISAGGNIVTAGLISSTGNIIGGNIETAGLISAGGNLLANNVNVTNTASVTGDVIANNMLAGGIVSATGNIVVDTGSFFVGNLIGNITGCIAVPGLNTEVLYNLTGSVGTSPAFTFNQSSNVLDVGGNITADNVISAVGNVMTSSFFVGNGAFLTGITSSGSTGIANGTSNISIPVASGNIAVSVAGTSNVAQFLTTGVSVTGNVTGSYFIGNGAFLTGIQATVIGTLSTLSVTGNINTGNLLAIDKVSAAGNVEVGAIITAAGNIYGNLIQGNTISGVGTVETNNYLGNNLYLDGAIEAGSGPGNIIYSTGDVTADGNLIGNNLNVSNVISATGNVTAGNVFTSGFVSATGNITSGNVYTGNLSLSGNVISTLNVSTDVNSGNVNSLGLISAQGNVIGSNVTVSTGLLKVASLGADPTGVAGAIYFNTGNNKFRGFNGTTWQDLN